MTSASTKEMSDRIRQQTLRRILGTVVAVSICGLAAADEPPSAAYAGGRLTPITIAGENAISDEHRDPARWVVRIDNDLFAARGADRDYTGGLAFSAIDKGDRAATTANRAIQRWLDARLGTRTAPGRLGRTQRWTVLEAGVQGFTPDNIATDSAQLDDRPYADFIYLGTSSYALDDTRRTLYESTVTLGAMGLGGAELLQGSIHSLTGSVNPRGYRHQVADGGELTLRYQVARHYLVSDGVIHQQLRRDLRLSFAGAVGSVTDASVGLEWRLGHIATPWWAAASRSGVENFPGAGLSARSELHFVAGARAQLRLYSALLQGQFRDSDVALRSSMLRHVVGEAWIGGVARVRNVHVSYTVRYQSSEIRRGVGARGSSWAEIAVTRESN